ncbi:hypothetical protein FRAHR75_150051 [Frankia sp. Hr75.2]|nr:hypothetical protein FRAHR75_150051 [Frankia sp. Hr75.2]
MRTDRDAFRSAARNAVARRKVEFSRLVGSRLSHRSWWTAGRRGAWRGSPGHRYDFGRLRGLRAGAPADSAGLRMHGPTGAHGRGGGTWARRWTRCGGC